MGLIRLKVYRIGVFLPYHAVAGVVVGFIKDAVEALYDRCA